MSHRIFISFSKLYYYFSINMLCFFFIETRCWHIFAHSVFAVIEARLMLLRNEAQLWLKFIWDIFLLSLTDTILYPRTIRLEFSDEHTFQFGRNTIDVLQNVSVINNNSIKTAFWLKGCLLLRTSWNNQFSISRYSYRFSLWSKWVLSLLCVDLYWFYKIDIRNLQNTHYFPSIQEQIFILIKKNSIDTLFVFPVLSPFYKAEPRSSQLYGYLF